MYKGKEASIIVQDNCRIFVFCAEGEYIKFNVDYLPEEKEKWFCEVVGGLIRESIARAKKYAIAELQYKIKSCLDINN